MTVSARLLSAGLVLVAVVWVRPAVAAKFQITFADSAGIGFNDPTPAAPVGGNSGATVGEQRRIAFQFAADQWGKVLDSAVPITARVSFAPLACSGGSGLLGQAAPRAMIYDEPGLPAGVVFPVALANRIAGRDLDTTDVDIQAQFNGDIVSCFGKDWYYGLDGNKGTDEDLIEVVMHELAHGLGFTSQVDKTTGELFDGLPDSYTQHLLDNTVQKLWPAMTNAERLASITNARNVVWDGAYVTAAAAKFLVKGVPSITISPAVPGFSGIVGEPNFGPMLSSTQATGTLVFTSTVSDCSVPGSYSGKIPVFATRSSTCSPLSMIRPVQTGGGIAAIYVADTNASPPPHELLALLEDLPKVSVTIPSLQLTAQDGALLRAAAGPLTATLSADLTRGVGTDQAGHVYVFASNPVRSGSTISHWDPLVRPNLLLEPVAPLETVHDLTMERALMIDIGWTPFCGNGKPDPGEACDDGASNSDTAADACRTTCEKAACGDSVTDTGEQCDQGSANNDTTADACRTTCKKAACGDGVTDTGEQCDQGAANNDTAPGACRTTCKAAACGDGVTDPGEQCDPKDVASGPCRPDCTKQSAGGGGGGGCCTIAGQRPAPAWSALMLLVAAATLRLRRRRDNRR